MRRPTPLVEQLAWWRRAAATGQRTTDEWPHCGWFKQRKEARSKIWLPAQVWLHQEIDWQTGELTAPEEFRLSVAGRTWMDQDTVQHRCLFLWPVSLDEWRWLTARLALHSVGTETPAYMSA